MPRNDRRPGSWTGYVLGMALGVLAAVTLEAALWMVSGSGRTFADAVAHGLRTFAFAEPWSWFLISGGALIGIIIAGVARGSFEAQDVGQALATFWGLLGGAIIGAVLALTGYAFLLAQTGQAPSLAQGMARSFGGFLTGDVSTFALTAGGGAIGVSVGAFMIDNNVIRRTARTLLGGFLGLVAGLLIYVVAYVAVNHREIPDSPTYFLYVGEAIYTFSALEFTFAAAGTVLGLMMGRYTWRFYGVVSLISLIFVVIGFLGYAFFITLPKVDPGYQWLSLTLFVAEAFSLTMVVLYSFYTIDVATRKEWRKVPKDTEYSPFFVPKVAFQVPTFNEPPELVKATLDRLLAVDYPKDRFMIMLMDDSTKEESYGPLEEYCEQNGIFYHRREDRAGYKAGALNKALELAPEDVDLFAIIDADYQVTREYLQETVGYFVNPDLGWVQTPQDYRNRDQSFLAEQYYLADAYFYKTVMPSRNEENTIIFAGTMGILRREALVDAGGWGEKYISEDAELSIRMLNNNWDSLYINKTYGLGLIPATFEGYKKQHYRWAFGGAKILRDHFGKLLVSRLSRRQRFDFFVGSAHWFEGLFIVVLAAILFLLGIGELFEFRVATHHSEEILLIGLVPLFLLMDGITRLHMVMHEKMRLSLWQTTKVLGMWFAVKFSNAFGALKSLVGFTMPFVRTPKAPDERIGRGAAIKRAVRVAPFETVVAAIMIPLALALGLKMYALSGEASQSAIVTRGFLTAWIAYYGLIFLAAPLYAYKSYVTFVPDDELETQRPAGAAAA